MGCTSTGDGMLYVFGGYSTSASGGEQNGLCAKFWSPLCSFSSHVLVLKHSNMQSMTTINFHCHSKSSDFCRGRSTRLQQYTNFFFISVVFLNDMWSVNISRPPLQGKDTWTQIFTSTQAPSPRAAMGFVSTNCGYIHLFGGAYTGSIFAELSSIFTKQNPAFISVSKSTVIVGFCLQMHVSQVAICLRVRPRRYLVALVIPRAPSAATTVPRIPIETVSPALMEVL